MSKERQILVYEKTFTNVYDLRMYMEMLDSQRETVNRVVTEFDRVTGHSTLEVTVEV